MNRSHNLKLLDKIPEWDVVIIGGGASGLGENIVEHFMKQKSKVAYLDIEENLGIELAKKME